ncbi:MAG: AAA family ATPase, partial [Deltaproteobacteria bacterium]|nr:AAA family ATPase [Deltaproteobacteria bacterium]
MILLKFYLEIKENIVLNEEKVDVEITDEDLAAAEFLKNSRETLMKEIRKVIIGQQEVIDELLITLFSRGHCLLVGVPGLAKTLLISSLAQILELQFNRVQFTPDLMPADIIGTDIIQEDVDTGARLFEF